MKPKDLKVPFSWEDRHVFVADRVWYVPDYHHSYDEYHFPGWQDALFFGNDNPVHVEYCTGNGAWIADKARYHPGINWVAVEKRFDRVRKIWSKIKNFALSNLVVICGEGYTATHQYFHDRSIAAVYINFPDPWPKARHHKHRLMHPAFVEEMWRILEDEGTLILVTDDQEYSEVSIDNLCDHGGFHSIIPEPLWVDELPGYGSSYFEALWRHKGRRIRFHQFAKRGLVFDGDRR